MGFGNLFNRLCNKTREEAPEASSHLLETLDDDAVMPNAYSIEEQKFDHSNDPALLALRVPEILPCGFDITVEFWLERISLWGELKILYINSEGKKARISRSEFEEAMTQPEEMIRLFGKWSFKKTGIKSFEASREFRDMGGRKRKETYIVDIELKDDLKRAFQGKF